MVSGSCLPILSGLQLLCVHFSVILAPGASGADFVGQMYAICADKVLFSFRCLFLLLDHPSGGLGRGVFLGACAAFETGAELFFPARIT